MSTSAESLGELRRYRHVRERRDPLPDADLEPAHAGRVARPRGKPDQLPGEAQVEARAVLEALVRCV